MDAAPEALSVKLDVSVDLAVNGRPVHIEAKVAGEGHAAERAADELSRAIAQVIAGAANVTTPAPQPASSTPLASTDASPELNTMPAPASQPIAAARTARPPMPPSGSMLWVQRNRARINIGFGIVLVALALLVPLIVPPAQRSDVLVLTILFTLSGALLLFTAFLPSRSKTAQSIAEPALPKRAPTSTSSAALAARREQLLKPAAKRARLKTGWGIALSFVFIIAGLFAPFLLGAANADERFIIMLGFVPISVVGFFMLAVFGRQYFNKLVPAGNHPAPAAKSGAPAARRAPVSRVPQNIEYRAIVPVAIVSAFVLMIVVVALVIYATFASVAR